MLGGGAGHIFDMIARNQQNLAMRRKRTFFKNRQNYNRTAEQNNINIRTASKAEMKAIRDKIEQKRIIRRRKFFLAFMVSLLITILIIYGLIAFFMHLHK